MERRDAKQERRRARAEAKVLRRAAQAATMTQAAQQFELDLAEEPEWESEFDAEFEPALEPVATPETEPEVEPENELEDDVTQVLEIEREPEVVAEPEPTAKERRAERKAAVKAEKAFIRAEREILADVPEPPNEVGSESSGRGLTAAAGIVGALGLLFSVVLAVGALLVALGIDSGGFYSVVETICDTLTTSISGLISFSGANADKKEALVTWGLGSIAFLVIGMIAQSYLRARLERQDT